MRTARLVLALLVVGCGSNGADDDEDASPDPAIDAADSPSNVYTIGGADGSYADFTSAIADLTSGAIAPGTDGILFSVRPGEYPERLTIGPIDGAGVTAPIIFQAESGDVVLRGTGTTEVDAMVTLEAADYVAFEGIDIASDGTSSATAVEIGFLLVGTASDGATGNRIVNARIDMGAAADVTRSRGVAIRSAVGEDSPSSAHCNDNVLRDLEIDRVAVAIEMRGPVRDVLMRPLLDRPDSGNRVERCVLGTRGGLGHEGSGGAAGVRASNQIDLVIEENHIERIRVAAEPALPVSVNGISLDAASGRISENRIHDLEYQGSTGSAVTGLRLSPHPTQPLVVANNTVSGLRRNDYTSSVGDPSTYVKGIWAFRCSDCTDQAGTVLARHNTVAIESEGGTQHPTAALVLAGGSSGGLSLSAHGNILVNRVVGSGPAPAFALIDGHDLAEREFLDSDDNLLYVEGDGAILAELGRAVGSTPTDATTISEWTSLSGEDVASASAAPAFIGSASGDLHLTTAFAGQAVSRCSAGHEENADMDGDVRSVQTPHRGADELP